MWLLPLALWSLPLAASPSDVPLEDEDAGRTAEGLPMGRSTAIVGGTPSDPDAFPSVVALFTRNGTYGCTGTLIAPDLVLTAGHCAASVQRVLAGTVEWSEGGSWYEIDEVWVHPDYAITYDVALVRLSVPVPDIEPAPLLLACDASDILLDDAAATIVGFGDLDADATVSTDRLHAAEVTIRDALCLDPDRSCNAAVSPGGELIAGGDGVDTCTGDSGGPLFVEVDGQWRIAGVTSRQALPSTVPCGDGGIYPRADAFAPWAEATGALVLDWPDCPDEAPLNRPPTVLVDAITAVQNGPVVSTVLEILDDPAQDHRLELLDEPPAGQVWLEDRTLFVRPSPWSAADYGMRVQVTDDGSPAASTTVEVPIDVLGVTVVRPTPARGCQHAATPSWASWIQRRRVSRGP